MPTFTKRQILHYIPEANGDLLPALNYILTELNIRLEDINPNELTCLKANLSTLRTKRNIKLKEVCRIKAKFEKKNSIWLDSEFTVPSLQITDKNQQNSSTHVRPGRPSLSYEEKSDRSKRRDSANISKNLGNDPQRILQACRHAAKTSGDKDLFKVISEISKSPERPKKIRKLLDKPKSLTPKTPQEALAFLLDKSLSKDVYTSMRLETKSCGADVWPTYNKVREAKSVCRPPKETIKIEENKAEVSLQALLNHTAERLVILQREVILQSMENMKSKLMEVVLLCSWGFDGSSGHSEYKQNYKEIGVDLNISDANLFATSLIPLRLLNKNNDILWNNKTSQSSRFCRPVKLQTVKETESVILEEKRNMEEQISKLEILEIEIDADEGHRIQIHFSLFLTLIDGKVLNIITGTKSMQTCPVCHATPKTFNTLSNKDNGIFLPNTNALIHGISPLHSWIRIFECCLHISYRLPMKVWQVRGVKNKTDFSARKSEIQKTLKSRLGLIVDKPKPGGSGTTNDGNTARRAFENPEILSECLGLNCQLLKNFKTILIALSIHLPIDSYEFDKLCSLTAEMYVEHYSWYPMPATLHKILVHGADIINTSILPVGMLGEEASESRNKDFKKYRNLHSRKISRNATMEDVFYRLIDTSDVIISSINIDSRSQYNKIKCLVIPEETRVLLAAPKLYDDEDDDNDDDDEEVGAENEDTGLLHTFSHLDELELSDDEFDLSDE